jgi:hypothetical protein
VVAIQLTANQIFEWSFINFSNLLHEKVLYQKTTASTQPEQLFNECAIRSAVGSIWILAKWMYDLEKVRIKFHHA